MLNIPKQYTSLKYVSPISWKDIFSKWRELEAWQESWKIHWEERGFSSWDEWREIYSAPLEPEKLNWELYQVADPLRDFPLINGVPSRAWVDRAYNGERTKQLGDILELPIVKENRKIEEIKKNFPEETMLTGIIYQNKIVLIEGQHRACVMASWDSKIPFNSDVKLALSLWEKEEIPVIGGNYKNKNQVK